MSIFVAVIAFLSLGFLFDLPAGFAAAQASFQARRRNDPAQAENAREKAARNDLILAMNNEPDADAMALIGSVLDQLGDLGTEGENIFAGDAAPAQQKPVISEGEFARDVLDIALGAARPAYFEHFDTDEQRLVVCGSRGQRVPALTVRADELGRTMLCADNRPIAVFGQVTGAARLDALVA